MTPTQFKNARRRLGLETDQAAAAFLDVADRTIRRWTSGGQPIPRSVEIAMKLMIKFGVAPDDIR